MEHPVQKIQRFGHVIKIKPEKLQEYKEHHANVWPAVLEMIKKCNILNYSIFVKDNFLFSYMEYGGTDFDADINWWDAVTWANTLNWLGWSDWKLPSFDELNTIYANKHLLVNDGAPSWYWSSTQRGTSTGYAWIKSFHDGNWYGAVSKPTDKKARVFRWE